jgi:hypothetical protein
MLSVLSAQRSREARSRAQRRSARWHANCFSLRRTVVAGDEREDGAVRVLLCCRWSCSVGRPLTIGSGRRRVPTPRTLLMKFTRSGCSQIQWTLAATVPRAMARPPYGDT